MSLSFNELIPNASVRVAKIADVCYMSVRDLIMVMCDQNQDRAGKTWRNIDVEKTDEVRQFLTNFKFSGRGQQEQPVITLEGALKLLMWLPGDQAKAFRVKAAEIITRYLAGDATLVQELQANARSSEPIAQMAREALGKRKAEVEDLEILERRARVALLESEGLAMARQNQEDLLRAYTSLCPGQTLDDRAKSMFRDTFLNMAGQGRAAAITAAAPAAAGDFEGKLLSIGELADRAGLRFKPGDMVKLGVRVKAWYYEKCREEPGTAPRTVNGRDTRVCVYPQRVWAGIEETLRDHAAAK